VSLANKDLATEFNINLGRVMSTRSPPHLTRAKYLVEAVSDRIRSMPLPADASDTAVAEILGNLDELAWLLAAFPNRSVVGRVLQEIAVELILALLREFGRSSNWRYPSNWRLQIVWSVSERQFATSGQRAA
jgi:hypothetical protein